MSYRIEQPLPAWWRIDIPSVAGFSMASAGLIALIVEVNVRGWWGLATSWVDLIVLIVWLSLSGWLSAWAFENAEGWWHVLSFLGAVVSVIGLAILLVLAVVGLVSEHPDILINDSKQKRKGSRNRRPRTGNSWRRPDIRRALAGAGLCVLLVTALVVIVMAGWMAGVSVWAGEVLGDLVAGWLEQQYQ